MWQQAQAGRELAKKDLRPRESALRTRGRAGAEIRRGAGAVQRHDRDRRGRQGAVRPGGRRRLEGGESRRRGTGAAGRRRRIGGGELPERRDGLFARYGRNLDDHRRAGRAGGQRLSRGRHPRHERHVGDIQHQGDADAKDPNGQAPARLCARTRPRCRLPHHLIAPQADFATWAATRTQGGFDIRTFAVKAKPLGAEEGYAPA